MFELHDGLQFQKNDNFSHDPIWIAGKVKNLTINQLRANNTKKVVQEKYQFRVDIKNTGKTEVDEMYRNSRF